MHPVATTAGVWTRNAVRPLPPTLMGIPADLDAATASGILGRTGAARAALENRMPPLDVSDDVGVGVLVAQRLGREVRDRLVEPLLGGVYAGRADEISLHAALPQVVTAVRQHGALLTAAASHGPAASPASTTPPATPIFAGIEGGVGRLAVETCAEIERRGGVVRRDSMVRRLTRTEGGWRLALGPTARPEVIDCDAVVVATPAAPAARLLREAAPAAALELAAIEYASMAIVTVAMRAVDVRCDLEGSGFLVPPVDGHVIKAATYTSRKWSWLPDDIVVVRCSVGRHREEAELQRDDSEMVEAVLADLGKAVGLRAPLVDAQVTRWGGALPQYAVGHLDRVRRVHDAVEDVPGLALCGAAFDGVGIPAVIATGVAAATRVVDQLTPIGTMNP